MLFSRFRSPVEADSWRKPEWSSEKYHDHRIFLTFKRMTIVGPAQPLSVFQNEHT